MTSMFRPMLAFDARVSYYEELLKLGPLLASYKLDGIRAIVKDGKLVSRTLKPIRNAYTQALFGKSELEGLDGELVVGAPYGEGVFARTSSGIMSGDGIPEVTYHVFDLVGIKASNAPWVSRLFDLDNKLKELTGYPNMTATHIVPVTQFQISSVASLLALEEQAAQKGYEGLIIRRKDSPYKFGRATPKEGYMGKLKRFFDSEAEIIGFEEMMHNDNPQTTDALGFSVRSSHKGNQRASGMLGNLQVRDVHNANWCFGIGSGFDHQTRQTIWEQRERYLGKIVKYKYLPIGMVDVPRHPIFLGFRDPIDMGSP